MAGDRRLLGLGALLLTAGCGAASTAPTVPSGPSSRPVAGADGAEGGAPAPDLPAGVRAEVRGAYGVVQVLERDGLLLLTIDGQVQGAAPVSGATGIDPLAPLLRAMRPRARAVLLLGLGTGKTAMDLRAAGLQVVAVERDHAVAELARVHFGYQGDVVIGDGLEHLSTTTERYDAIVLDGWIPPEPKLRPISLEPLEQAPAELSSVEQRRRRVGTGALKWLASRLRPDGVVLVRAFDTPRSADLSVVRLALRASLGQRRRPFEQLHGGGVGPEPQNLVLAMSASPLNVVEVDGIALWPIESKPSLGSASTSAVGLEPAEQAVRRALRSTSPPSATRPVDRTGYLVRLPGGELALDLPHWEMGAVRYLLQGDAVAALARRLPAGAVFPTEGDIRSDGDTQATLREVLGGGGVKRSETRFSPVVVRLSGLARLLSTVHPNAALRVPLSLRGDAPTDPRIPYGGSLYALELAETRWILDRQRWDQLMGAQASHLATAARSIRAGKLGPAAQAMASFGAAIQGALPGTAVDLALRALAMAEALRLREHETSLQAEAASDLGLAIRCDRAAQHAPGELQHSHQRLGSIGRQLRRCAESRYRAAARAGPAVHRELAAGRLIELLRRQSLRHDGSTTHLDAQINRWRKRFPLLQRRTAPPDLADLQP